MSSKYQGLELSYRLQLLPICKDELLRSWFIRNALFLNMKPSQLSTIIFQNTDIWKSDIDTQLSKKNIESLLSTVKIKKEDLDKTLISFNCDYFHPHLNDSKQIKWVLSIGVHQRGQKSSIQYCPVCISTDKTPYFRMYWRLGFLTVCNIHSVCFLDNCYKCGASIDLIRYEKNHNEHFQQFDYLKCSQCYSDLRDAPKIKPCYYELKTNREHFQLLTRGYGNIGNSNFNYSHIYFDGFKRIMSFILCSQNGFEMFKYIIRINNLDKKYITDRVMIRKHSEPEHLSLGMRKVSMIFSCYIMRDWPISFIKICKEFGITKRYMYSPHLSYPFWLNKVLDSELAPDKNIG
ncbi:TniQ family protein [Psychrobacter sp. TB55-MNA-CIBAN-0194]|uniref:TniQ family protein n=1 Tax=Psychrobacter sp. TB55-MNA-CIBAN-0194 TaxID=3140445 RepID=UPI0033269D39